MVAPEPVPADVGIIAALAIETGDIVDGLKAVRRYQTATVSVIEGERSGKIVAVAVSGPGRAPHARSRSCSSPATGHG